MYYVYVCNVFTCYFVWFFFLDLFSVPIQRILPCLSSGHTRETSITNTQFFVVSHVIHDISAIMNVTNNIVIISPSSLMRMSLGANH